MGPLALPCLIHNADLIIHVQRIDRIQSTLSSDLDHLFTTVVTSLAGTKSHGKLSDIDRSKLLADLTECLRTYDALGLWRDPEDILRREVVRAFVKKVRAHFCAVCFRFSRSRTFPAQTIHPSALTGPHSPITPHTPMATRQPSVNSNGSHPLRTPYTPFTAFASKQNPFDVSYGAALSSVHLLDDLDDPLAGLYNQILRFVERDLMKIMEVAEKISSKSVPTPGASSSETKPKNGISQQSFEIMANVVWAEIGQAIIDELGGTVFSAGRPAEFRKVSLPDRLSFSLMANDPVWTII
jgi:conserved oligomeric Golgi complex subunit 2